MIKGFRKGDKGDPGSAATIAIGTVTTGAAGTQASVVNSGTSSAAVLDITIPRGADGDMSKAVYDPDNTGYTKLADSGVTAGTYNGMAVDAKGRVTAASNLVDTDAYNITAGGTFAQKRVGRNRTYNYLWVDCRKADGITSENPTGLTISIYRNGTAVYTSPTITTASFTVALSLSISAGDLVAVVPSNTTGLTGGLAATLGMVDAQ